MPGVLKPGQEGIGPSQEQYGRNERRSACENTQVLLHNGFEERSHQLPPPAPGSGPNYNRHISQLPPSSEMDLFVDAVVCDDDASCGNVLFNPAEKGRGALSQDEFAGDLPRRGVPIVVRLVEVEGRETGTRLKVFERFRVSATLETDLLELSPNPLELSGPGELDVRLRAHEIKTIILNIEPIGDLDE